MQRLEIARGVLERFAFSQTGSARRDVDYVRAQPNRGQLKRGPGSCARFDKKIYQRLPAQRRNLLDLARTDFFERIGRLENESDFLGRQFAQPEQIFAVPTLFHVLSTQTPSGSLALPIRTRTFSAADVGRFFPT